MPAASLLSAAAIGYLLGSIPFGLLLTRFAGHGDIRQIGSGSIGATNVLRTGSKGLAALTLLLDLAKGAAAVVIAQRWGHIATLAAAARVAICPPRCANTTAAAPFAQYSSSSQQHKNKHQSR